MRRRRAVGTALLIALKVVTIIPHVAHAQGSLDMEISCESPNALQRALSSASSPTRIIVKSGTCIGNLTFARDIRIQGNGSDLVTLRGADASLPVVTVPRGVTAIVSGVTIAGGRVGVSVTGRASLFFTVVSHNASGGIEVRDTGYLEGDKLRITQNTGPGIAVTKAEVALRGSLIAHNATGGQGGAGVLLVGGKAEVTGTQIEDNDSVGDGGGVLALEKSVLTIDRVRLYRNTTRTGHGGGIALSGSAAAITASSVFENTADAGNGGGVAVLNGGQARLTSTTLASNVASFQFPERPGGWGGGIYVDKSSKAALVHTTIVMNSARFAPGIASNNTVTMDASLLSGNLGASRAGDCGGSGRVESKGWNLLMQLGECRFLAKPGDLMGASPRLGTPGSYGGTWNTVPLRSGSPAIDRIPIEACAKGVDQRLKPRPASGACDVGAFERQPEDGP